MDDNMKLKGATEEEMLYMFNESMQLQIQTGFMGYLRGDFGGGEQFYYSWFDGFRDRKTEEFRNEFNNLVDCLRNDPENRGIMRNLESMKALCQKSQNSKLPLFMKENSYGFRINSDKYAYLIRCCPSPNDYNFSIYAYEKESLDGHIMNARKGIRFISTDYATLFIIRDGERIKITKPDGEVLHKTCRYIDDYHVEVGFNLYHIAEFAEKMKLGRNKVEPELDNPERQHKARAVTAHAR